MPYRLPLNFLQVMNQLIIQKPPKCPKKEKNNPETSNEGKNILNQSN